MNALGGGHGTLINLDFDGRCIVDPRYRHERINRAHLLKTGCVETEETWTGSLSQTSGALDETDLDVFLNGADMVVEEEFEQAW